MTARGYTTEEQGRLNNFAVEPKMYVDSSSSLGFTKNAEKLNGRLARLNNMFDSFIKENYKVVDYHVKAPSQREHCLTWRKSLR